MRKLFLILALAVTMTSCGQKKPPVQKKVIHDGMTYDYVLYPKQDSLRYYVSEVEGDTFKVSMVFEKIQNGFPLPDVITQYDNALSEYSQSLHYQPMEFSGDNILNPLGWNFSKDQLFNLPHHENTLAFLQVDGWVELSFQGHKIEYHAEKYEGYGIAGVSIDRGPETMVDLYAPVEYNNSQAVFVKDSLKNDTTHIIRVRYTHQRNPNSNNANARINLDKFVTYWKQGNLFVPPPSSSKSKSSSARMPTEQYEPPKSSH